MPSPRDRGSRGEELAGQILKKLGYAVKDTNYHSRWGEIDLVVCDSVFICFVEVKTRRAGGMVSGAQAVTLSKQRKIIKTALCYLQENSSQLQPRFDVLCITTDRQGQVCDYTHLTGAFDSEAYQGI